MVEKPERTTIAAIDIGSNSIHMTLARREGSELETFARLKDPARLAAELGRDGNLSLASIDRAIATLCRFKELADVHDAQIRATATAAMRAAKNRDVFLRRAKEEAGIDVYLIPGTCEAELTYAGILNGLHVAREQTVFVVDVGGGSSELIFGRGNQLLLTTSIALGSLVVSTRLLGRDPITRKTVRRARHHIEQVFEPKLSLCARLPFDEAIATAGTIQRVLPIAHALADNARPEKTPNRNVHGHRLTAEQLDAVVERFIAAPTHEMRLCIPAIDPERADTLLGGLLVFQVLTKRLGIKSWIISMSALRSGICLAPDWPLPGF